MALNTTLAKLLIAQVSVHSCMTGLRMAMPLYALHLGHSALAVGVLVALVATSNLLLAMRWGALVDRYGLHKPWKLSAGMAVTAALLAAGVGQYPAFAVAAFLSGGAMGLAQVTVQRRASAMPLPEHQKRELWGWLSLAAPAANFVGPGLAGLMLDHTGAAPLDRWAIGWTCLGVGALAASSLWWLRGIDEAPSTTPLGTGVGGRKRDLIGDARMRRLLIVAWTVSSCWDVHAFVVPLLGHERGFSASMIGLILGSFAFAAAVIRPLWPHLTRGIAEPVIMTWMMGATSVLLLLYPWMPSAAWAMVASVCLGVTLGGVQPMVLSTLQQMTPPERMGQALGLRLMTVSASSVAMPLLFGSVGAIVGVVALFAGAALVAGAGARMAWKVGQSI